MMFYLPIVGIEAPTRRIAWTGANDWPKNEDLYHFLKSVAKRITVLCLMFGGLRPDAVPVSHGVEAPVNGKLPEG